MTRTMALSSLASVQVPLSAEENDLIQRSSKKVKNGEGSAYEEGWPKLGSEGKNLRVPGISFAEKLQGISRDEKMEEKSVADLDLSDDSISDNEDNEPVCKISEDPNRNFPTFSFSGKMRKQLSKAWKTAVIVKLLGKNIGYKLLLSILQKLWAKKGVISLINIGNGFFVVKLSNKEDYLNALTGGPWMIFDHYLTVRPWEPQFQTKSASINKVAVWCKLVSKATGIRANGGGCDAGSSVVSERNTAGMIVGAEIRTDADSWRVVQRPRRQKKPSKERPQGELRRPEEGSRFGVLVEEGDGGDVTQTVTDRSAVRDATVEASRPSLPKVEQHIGDRKGDSKRKTKKGHIQRGESSVQNLSRFSSRKEKRSRDMERGESKNKGLLMLTYGEVGVVSDKGDEWEVEREKGGEELGERGPRVGQDPMPKVDPLSLGPLISNGAEPFGGLNFNGAESVGGLEGKFWAAQSSDPQMEVDDCEGEIDGTMGRQLFHCRCRFPGGCVFFITAVYAIPDYRHKHQLWAELRSLAALIVDPWAVMGDFNDIACSSERTVVWVLK
ncbi:hypothetical protein K1719_024964 [Acacia pycnantha]|nr:hypothetical protein K1719_024964 [Acacia pycnantha]